MTLSAKENSLDPQNVASRRSTKLDEPSGIQRHALAPILQNNEVPFRPVEAASSQNGAFKRPASRGASFADSIYDDMKRRNPSNPKRRNVAEITQNDTTQNDNDATHNYFDELDDLTDDDATPEVPTRPTKTRSLPTKFPTTTTNERIATPTASTFRTKYPRPIIDFSTLDYDYPATERPTPIIHFEDLLEGIEDVHPPRLRPLRYDPEFSARVHQKMSLTFADLGELPSDDSEEDTSFLSEFR